MSTFLDRNEPFLVMPEQYQQIPTDNPRRLAKHECLSLAIKDVPGVEEVDVEVTDQMVWVTVRRKHGIGWDVLSPLVDKAISRCCRERTFVPQAIDIDADGNEVFAI